MNNLPTVLISESIYFKGKNIFESADRIRVQCVPADEDLLSDTVLRTQASAVVLGVEKYTGRLYDTLPEGGLIARFGVGYDGIDLKKVKKSGLILTNTPNVLDRTVAELTVFMAGELMRASGKYTTALQSGTWNSVPGRDLYGKTWGIIGLGNIGRQLSQILHFGFGVRVIGLKRNTSGAGTWKHEYGIDAVYTDFEAIAKQSDILSLHLPARQETHHFLDQKKIDMMKNDSYLINTGRGSLVDESALFEALQQGKLSGTALDVYEKEPYSPVHPEKDFRKLDNVVLTPHIGSYTTECSERMAMRVLQNIYGHLDGQKNRMDIVS